MSTPTVKPKAMIQDNTRCIGCRACMVACKSWNDRPEDHTDFFAGNGYQNPRDLDANNYTLITFNEVVTGEKPDWVFGRQLCMHCEQPACASACPTTAMFKTDLGPVVFDESRCIGCRACMQACPFIIPKYDYESFAPKIHKCTFCADRLEVGLEPACAKVCPTGAITFGDRDDMVVEAKRRIAEAPGTYIPEIYGLEEVGGTSVLHLSSVPFEQIGYITGLPKAPMPDLTHRWLRMTAPVFAVLYGVFGALNWIVRRRMRRERNEGEHSAG
jgi:formate dehydrogenase iron-sulfur subunit